MGIIETPRLILRPFEERDAADVFAYASDPRVGPAAGWPPHRDEAESLEIIRTVFAAPHMAAVVLKESGRVVGSVGFTGVHDAELPGPDNELGYALGHEYWGQGLIPEAAIAVMEYGFTDLGLETIWCGYYEGNGNSRRVIEKCGFRYRFSRVTLVPLMDEARMSHYYAISRQEWRL